MSKTPHIVIIGAGLIGLSTADSLTARGAQVSVIDKRGGPGEGASFKNSGMIHPSQAWPWLNGDFSQAADHVLELARRSKRLLAEKAGTLGLEMAQRPAGCLQVFDSFDAGEHATKRYKDLGITFETVSKCPESFGRFGLLLPNDHSGNAYAYCQALEKNLRQRGAVFRYGSTHIPDADHVVIAGGTGSRDIAKTFDVDLPVVSVRGHALDFRKPDIALPLIPVMHHGSRSALTVFEDHVRLSGTIDESRPNALINIWTGIAPDIVAALGPPIAAWSEDRPMSQLGRPVITGLRPGLWVSSGHGHMGWTLSAGSGELMADMILEGRNDVRFGL